MHAKGKNLTKVCCEFVAVSCKHVKVENMFQSDIVHSWGAYISASWTSWMSINNRRCMFCDMAAEPNVLKSVVHKIVHEKLTYEEERSRWVQKKTERKAHIPLTWAYQTV